VVTGIGTIHGRPVAIMANDQTVKAGSWGERTVEKILRIQETAGRLRIPLVYLVDSAGARITDQLDMFPGRRHAGRIFRNQVRLSGSIPQICLLFGPSAAGGAYIPAFCDVVFMVEGNASMYLGSPRMAEMVIGEKTTLEEMGGARMHCEVSGCADLLAKDELSCLAAARDYLAFMPQNAETRVVRHRRQRAGQRKRIDDLLPENQNQPFDMLALIDTLVDAALSSKSRSATRASSSPASPASADAPWASWPTSPSGRAACSSSIRRTRPRASCGCATPSAFPCCSCPTCPAS
jgi:acetyl-CoA carboxylase carboxyltransferase component